jgi:tetratricopeptide (TPR) repeat protein
MGQSTIAVGLTAALLTFESLWFLIRPRRGSHDRAWGLLLLVIAGWVLLWARFFILGRLVVSPGLGVMLVQGGTLTRIGMYLFLGGISIGAGLAWNACHDDAREGLLQSLAWRLGLGVSVAVLSASQLHPLRGLNEPELPPIYSYDLWSPPLLLWLCLCLAGGLLDLLRVRSLESFAGLAAAFISVLALLSLGRAEFTESTSAYQWQLVWRLCLMLAFPLALGLWSALLLRELQRRWAWLREGRHEALVAISWTIGVGLMGVGLVALSLHGAQPWPCWAALGGMLALVGVAAARRLGGVELPGLSSLSCRRIVTLVALLALPWLLAMPLFSPEFEVLFSLAGQLLLASVLAETLLKGPLFQVLRHWRSSATKGSLEAGPEGRVTRYGWLTRAGEHLRRGYDWLSARKPLRLLLATIPLTLVLLIAANEVPNAGKTVIEPFMVTGLSAPQEQAQELGQTLAESLTNALGGLKWMLQPEVVLQQPGDTHQMKQFGYASDTSGTAAAATQNLVLEIGGGIKVPFRMLAAPIQAPVRALLGVNVIRGTLYEEQNQYILLARSSHGESWRVELKKKQLSAEPKLADAVSRLTQGLAFEIISKDPRLKDTGITRSPEAFEAFHQGAERWESFVRTSDYDSLGQAIERFREAIQEDPSFALAYYRLGMALQKDGQTGQATNAFRTSITLNPQFLPGLVALANMSFHSGPTGFLQRTTVASPPTSEPMTNSGTMDARRSEARVLWQRIIQFPGHQLVKTQAYYGLCLLGFDAANEESHSSLASQKRLGAYFYCKRAERVYAQLPTPWHTVSDIRESEAHVQSTLGMLFERPQFAEGKEGVRQECPLTAGEQPPPQALPSWAERPRLLHFRAASVYYKNAAELSNDPLRKVSFQCGVARVAYLLGDEDPMMLLSKDASAHIFRADKYGDLVWDWEDIRYVKNRDKLTASTYRAALMEYEQAINLDPTNVDAMIRYAYNFWEWRFRFPKKPPPLGPSQEEGRLAEKFARGASELSSGSGDETQWAMANSALGEVFLGQARPRDAIREIEKIDRSKFKAAIFDEFWWDLAQAYRCEAARLERAGSDEGRAGALRRKARSLLEQIRRNDQEREDKIFAQGEVPTGSALPVCMQWRESGPA